MYTGVDVRRVLGWLRVRLLARKRVEMLGRSGGLSSGPILTGLSRTVNSFHIQLLSSTELSSHLARPAYCHAWPGFTYLGSASIGDFFSWSPQWLSRKGPRQEYDWLLPNGGYVGIEIKYWVVCFHQPPSLECVYEWMNKKRKAKYTGTAFFHAQILSVPRVYTGTVYRY